MSTGVSLIAAERQRQIEKGYDASRDAAYTEEELARAAVSYALPERLRGLVGYVALGKPRWWPWDAASWKPTPDDRIRELVKAGALIAAEIDRLRAYFDAPAKPGDGE